MSTKKQTVTIGGKVYDMATGKPVKGVVQHAALRQRVISDIAAPQKQSSLPRKTTTTQRRAARTVAPHAGRTLQRSTTLKRTALKKPARTIQKKETKIHQTVQRSARISKFAAAKKQEAPKEKPVDKDLLAQTRALEKANAEYQLALQKKNTPINSRVIKEHLLGKALQQVPTHHEHKKRTTHVTSRARFTSVAMTSLALLVLGGYLTYLNIPNLSIRVAAANSGVNANLPSYQPAGYQIHGPITYQEGEVNVAYKQNGSSLGYKLTQRPSDWDPLATLDNFVEADSKSNYQIQSVHGLTVYTYKKKVVWVNDGILHIIDGSAPLSSKQVERIVASM